MIRRRQQQKTLRTDAATLVDTCAGLQSRLAARRITQFLDREMAGGGLSTAQLGLIRGAHPHRERGVRIPMASP